MKTFIKANSFGLKGFERNIHAYIPILTRSCWRKTYLFEKKKIKIFLVNVLLLRVLFLRRFNTWLFWIILFTVHHFHCPNFKLQTKKLRQKYILNTIRVNRFFNFRRSDCYLEICRQKKKRSIDVEILQSNSKYFKHLRWCRLPKYWFSIVIS